MMKEITYAQAICEILDEEMAKDDSIVLIGEDIGFIGGNFKATVGLLAKYGAWRVKDAPISEAGFVGMGIGMALTGLRPVIELMFADFILVAADQVINQVAKIRYMSGGQLKVPLVIRAPIGGGRSSAAQHSQSMQALVAHFPGLKVVLPSTAQEVQGLLKTALHDDNPVIFLEHKMEYNKKFVVDEVVEPIPFGKANIVREGKDISIAATSSLVMRSQEAAERLEGEGISVEVIDLRTVVPLDIETVARSVKKTGKLIVADEAHETCGVGAEVGFQIMEKAFYDLDAPVGRVNTPSVPLPFSPALEFPIVPSTDRIYNKVVEMCK